jgi:hypothetical protein
MSGRVLAVACRARHAALAAGAPGETLHALSCIGEGWGQKTPSFLKYTFSGICRVQEYAVQAIKVRSNPKQERRCACIFLASFKAAASALETVLMSSVNC